jgi:hypothetical protein
LLCTKHISTYKSYMVNYITCSEVQIIIIFNGLHPRLSDIVIVPEYLVSAKFIRDKKNTITI